MKNSKILIFLVIAAFTVALGLFLLKPQTQNNVNSVSTQPTGIFAALNTLLPQANWSTPQGAAQQTIYGDIAGTQSTGEITSDKAMIDHYENVSKLTSMGYKEDINLSADGPGSSTWGYKKTDDGKDQIITFSYSTTPTSTNPNEPISFDCPCKVKVSVFESTPFLDENK